MQLKDFIKTAITDIAQAVSELQRELKNGTVINPTLSTEEQGKSIIIDDNVCMIERLNFDIAVTATEQSELSGKTKASISVLGINVGAENAERTENVSRLTFSLPLVLPIADVKTPKEKLEEKKPIHHRPVKTDPNPHI